MYPNLKLQLWRTGLRQNQLAKLLHIDETVLSKIVNGYREPSAAVKRRIAEVLRKEESWLFEPNEAVMMRSENHEEHAEPNG
ncbi:MAG TPA: helix-turn-helix transcriptional regulator [Bryobacteraceae bacterium]|nr:helix-turn-helix transcriptional regulator [Bryobacteraceae bacterium]